MSVRAEFMIPGLEVAVDKGSIIPTYKDGKLTINSLTLEMDALYSTSMDMFAGLLLPQILEVRGDRSWLLDLARKYRIRVILEEAVDVKYRIGDLYKLVETKPHYPPISRMSVLRNLYSCPYNNALDDMEGLAEEYRSYYQDLDIDPGKPLKAAEMEATIHGVIPSIRRNMIAAYHSTLTQGVKMLMPIPRELSRCQPRPELEEPWKLLSIPEGRLALNCGVISRGLEELAGKGYRCKSPNPISSSLVCNGPQGSVVVKSYMRMYLKWLPAALAASTVYGYRLGPRERLAAEYIYLRKLRGIVKTPRVLLVCGDHYTAKMVREYLEGTILLGSTSRSHWIASGEGLARIHDGGYTLGDTNPGNLLMTSDGEPGIIDAEQAKEANLRRMAWDLIVFTVTSIFYGTGEDLILGFLDAYKDSKKEPEKVLSEALEERNWISLMSIPIVAQKARQLLKGVAQGKG